MKKLAYVFASVSVFLDTMSGQRISSKNFQKTYRSKFYFVIRLEFSSKIPKKRRISTTLTMIKQGRKMDTFTHSQGYVVMPNSYIRI